MSNCYYCDSENVICHDCGREQVDFESDDGSCYYCDSKNVICHDCGREQYEYDEIE